MSRERRVQKTRDQRLRDLEVHLHFLWEARILFPKQPSRFKQIASELRVLVCDQRANRRLLISLMAEFGFQRPIQPPGPPFEKTPISTIGWRHDPAWRKLAEEVEAASGDAKRLDELLEAQAALRRPMPLSEYVDKALAVMVEQRDFSYGELVRAIAQQLGGSHEDNAVDESLVVMEQSLVEKLQGHLAPLVNFADLVLTIGMEFLAYVNKEHGYDLRNFVRDGDIVRPLAIDIDRLRELPPAPPTTSSRVGSDLRQEGTMTARLYHEHRDWITNSHAYDFGVMRMAGVMLSMIKEPTGVLRLRLEMDSGSCASIDHQLTDIGEPAIPVAVSWKAGQARFYVGGTCVGEVEISPTAAMPDAT